MVIFRAAVMFNHVHVVVTRCPTDGPAVRRVFKGVSQARLSELAADGVSRRWWTQRGSDRMRRGERSIAATLQYVADQAGILAEVVEMQVQRGVSSWQPPIELQRRGTVPSAGINPAAQGIVNSRFRVQNEPRGLSPR